jgi:hypothetical protein
MKNTSINLLAAAAISSVLFAFTAPSHSILATAIKGKVSPADGAVAVVAVSATDSAKGVISDGMFLIDTKPGTYKVTVLAKTPYKDLVKDNVEVMDGNTTDMGTITLQQ